MPFQNTPYIHTPGWRPGVQIHEPVGRHLTFQPLTRSKISLMFSHQQLLLDSGTLSPESSSEGRLLPCAKSLLGTPLNPETAHQVSIVLVIPPRCKSRSNLGSSQASEHLVEKNGEPRRCGLSLAIPGASASLTTPAMDTSIMYLR